MTTIFGWDMSHFDSPSIGNALAEGISFITHKAGGDSRSGDQELASWWSGVRDLDQARVLLGTYWVPRPDLYPNPTSEADRWVGTLDARCPGWRNRPHILQMDAERWPGGDKTKPGKAYLQKLGDQLVALMPKLRPICYASKGQYGDDLRGLTFPLWNARYPTAVSGGFKTLYARAGGDDGPGWSWYSGQMPVIWQYTSSAVIGGQTTCDANAYRGTLAELTALVAPGWETDMLTDEDLSKIRAMFTSELLVPGVDEKDGSKKTIVRGIRDARLAYERVQDSVLPALAALPAAVLEALGDPARSDQDVADALKAVLGDRAHAVGALLSA